MGREIRMVPADWQHPKNAKGHYIPLYGHSFAESARQWDEEKEAWEKGLRRDYSDRTKWIPSEAKHAGRLYTQRSGERPNPADYMPDWPAEQRTHCMMYEHTTEGTPISPAFATHEELARWLADSGASAFGSMTATYEQCLATCRAGGAVGCVFGGGLPLRSGVEASAEKQA